MKYRKYLFLLFLLFFVTREAAAQERRKVGLKGADTWKLYMKNDSTLAVSGDEIFLDVDDTWMDTCNYYRNMLEVKFRLRNSTKEIMLVNRSFDCWNDSGLSLGYMGDAVQIAPGETAELTMRINSAQKRGFGTSAQLPVIACGRQRSVTLRLKQRYTWNQCGETSGTQLKH
jgi:hypothetical protein